VIFSVRFNTLANIYHQHRTHLALYLRVFDVNHFLVNTKSLTPLICALRKLFNEIRSNPSPKWNSKFSCMLITITVCFGFVTAVPERFKFPKIGLAIALSVLAVIPNLHFHPLLTSSLMYPFSLIFYKIINGKRHQ
jgi:hypothetical protein